MLSEWFARVGEDVPADEPEPRLLIVMPQPRWWVESMSVPSITTLFRN